MNNKDKDMIMNPDLWNLWPFLPVKTDSKTGIIIDCSDEKLTTVFLINFYDIKSDTDFGKLEKEYYDSINEMLKAGWRVD